MSVPPYRTWETDRRSQIFFPSLDLKYQKHNWCWPIITRWVIIGQHNLTRCRTIHFLTYWDCSSRPTLLSIGPTVLGGLPNSEVFVIVSFLWNTPKRFTPPKMELAIADRSKQNGPYQCSIQRKKNWRFVQNDSDIPERLLQVIIFSTAYIRFINLNGLLGY